MGKIGSTIPRPRKLVPRQPNLRNSHPVRRLSELLEKLVWRLNDHAGLAVKTRRESMKLSAKLEQTLLLTATKADASAIDAAMTSLVSDDRGQVRVLRGAQAARREAMDDLLNLLIEARPLAVGVARHLEYGLRHPGRFETRVNLLLAKLDAAVQSLTHDDAGVVVRRSRRALRACGEAGLELAMMHKSVALAGGDDPVDVDDNGQGVGTKRYAIVLRSIDEQPVVNGVKKAAIRSTVAYDGLRALIQAGEQGLTKDRLDRQARHTDTRKALRELAASDPDWKAVILLPGTAGMRYRVRQPSVVENGQAAR